MQYTRSKIRRIVGFFSTTTTFVKEPRLIFMKKRWKEKKEKKEKKIGGMICPDCPDLSKNYDGWRGEVEARATLTTVFENKKK